MLSPLIAVVMTFSVLFTFTDFQLIYVLTRGGPLNATHLMATLSFQRAIPGGQLGEGAAIAVAMVPFLLAAILFSYFGLQRRRWQQGGRTTDAMAARPAAYRCRLRRKRRHELSRPAAAAARHGLPAARALRVRAAVPVLLDDDHGPEAELRAHQLPRLQPALAGEPDPPAHPLSPVRDLLSGLAPQHDGGGGRARPSCRWSRRCSPPMRSSASASRGSRWIGPCDLPRLSRAALDPVHPARRDDLQFRHLRLASWR